MAKLWISAGIRVTDGKSVEAAKKALKELVQHTRLEDQCYQFDLLQDKVDPRNFTLWECFENEEALAEHFRKEHTVQYIAQGWTDIIYSEKLTFIES